MTTTRGASRAPLAAAATASSSSRTYRRIVVPSSSRPRWPELCCLSLLSIGSSSCHLKGEAAAMLGGRAAYVPPPVRASTSGPPSYLESMSYTLFEVGGVPLRLHGAPSARPPCARLTLGRPPAIFPVMLVINSFIGARGLPCVHDPPARSPPSQASPTSASSSPSSSLL